MGENNSKWSNWQTTNLKNIQATHAAQFQRNKDLIKKWAKELNRNFLKKTYRWLTNTFSFWIIKCYICHTESSHICESYSPTLYDVSKIYFWINILLIIKTVYTLFSSRVNILTSLLAIYPLPYVFSDQLVTIYKNSDGIMKESH